MKNRQSVRKVQALVSIAAKTVRNTMDDRLDRHASGISTLQYGILRILQHGPQTITQISRLQMLDPSTLVPAVDALERNGFVRRTKDPKDRRRTPIEILEEGQQLLGRFPMLDETDDLVKALTQMSDEHQRQLVERLHELVGHLVGEEEIQGILTSIEAESEND